MTTALDAQLAAIAHPTRRAILQLTARYERSAGELSTAFAVTRPAVSQHIRVLVNAGLLVERRDQQRRLYRADTAAVNAFRRQFEQFWASGLAQLKATIESKQSAREEPSPRKRRRAPKHRRRG